MHRRRGQHGSRRSGLPIRRRPLRADPQLGLWRGARPRAVWVCTLQVRRSAAGSRLQWTAQSTCSPGSLCKSIRRFGSLRPAGSACCKLEAPPPNAQVCPWLRSWKRDALPTESHRLCAWLHRQGWLRRVYTQARCAPEAPKHTVPLAFQHARFSWSDFACGSLLVCLCSPGKRFSNEFTRFFAGPTCHPWKNVDGLHTHPSLELPRELVVECHGSIRGAVVLYGDPMPHRFYASWLGPTATNRNANG